MFVFSFNDARRNVAWKGFTLKWYAQLWRDGELLRSLATSLELALVAAAIATLLGLLASYALARHPKFRGRQGCSALLSVPLMMPEIVMGVGLLSLFSRARVPLNFWTLACAHAMIALPYTASAIRARLLSLKDSRLEDAAMDLGATEWQAFRKITLPLARPAIVAGALLAFTVSFEDFVTSFFIAGIGIVTLPIKIYSMMKFGVTPEINALACCLLLATVALLALRQRLLSGAQERAADAADRALEGAARQAAEPA
ncbi:MAG: ABC transporter permease [Elusimicrobia bacterium]|nr:ABC transporter permease [Elusimicrobiota bacterium]MDE2237664.1 ABC transporter permease [Elusimicrobiota bacterium]MDE2425465.1 ABC transporter permease [Elusimicrobiota bacterium]